MDKVCIDSIKTEAVIGVYEFEHVAPQPLLLDLELTTDFSRCFVSDDLNDSLDYDSVTRHVCQFCMASRFRLLEALAGGVIILIMEHYPVDVVAVRIRKPMALSNAMAMVWSERSRDEMRVAYSAKQG